MRERRNSSPAVTAAATALLFGLAALGTSGCSDDRMSADARRALGTQLGSAPPAAGSTARARGNRQAASVDDLMTARRYLEATIRLDPNNAGAQGALAGLGGPLPGDVDLASMDMAHMPGPVASRASASPKAASFSRVAFGDVGALGADVANAVRPWATVPRVTLPITRLSGDSGRPNATVVAATAATSDSAARDSTTQGTRRGRTRSTTARRRTTHDATVTLAARDDSSAASTADTLETVSVGASHEHKRTWPWTRMQRWLVAKGVAGGAGAGVVVGAIIGNVPGALIAGSLGGGALGFKRATKVGPAAPYPSAHDSAAFDADKRTRDAADDERKAKADTTAKVAVAHP